MKSSPNLRGFKPPRRRPFRVFDTNRRDGNSQRHERMVHIPFIAVPALPVIVIASPFSGAESLLVSAATATAAAIGRLAWNFVIPEG